MSDPRKERNRTFWQAVEKELKRVDKETPRPGKYLTKGKPLKQLKSEHQARTRKTKDN